MIRIKDSFLETSYNIFKHLDGHCVGYFSCIHLGKSEYYKNLQHLINTWRGIIFEERATGDQKLYDTIPKDKVGLQSEWRRMHKLQWMKSQREVVTYPRDHTVSPDISWPEMVRLYDTVSVRVPVTPRYLKRIMGALEKNPREAYVVLWYTLIVCLKAWEDPVEGASYREEMVAQEIWFSSIREHIASLPQVTTRLLALYGALEHIYLHEPTTSFVPERDTAVLRSIDLERCGQKRNILLVYGGGHYRGIARGLYDRGYAKKKEIWIGVCKIPIISLGDFTKALIKISKAI